MRPGVSLLRLAATGTAVAALAGTPTELLASFPVVCLTRTLLDLECFGCGMTRALSHTLHGQWLAAYAANRAVLLVLPSAVLFACRDVHAVAAGRFSRAWRLVFGRRAGFGVIAL